jgi:hypothetical protein
MEQSAPQSPSCTSTITISEGLAGRAQSRGPTAVDFIGAREPQLITYGFYIDEDAAKMTVVAVHPDSAPLELHMDIGTKEFA